MVVADALKGPAVFWFQATSYQENKWYNECHILCGAAHNANAMQVC